MAVAQDKRASELTAPVSIADTDAFPGYRPGTGGEPNLDIRATAGLIRAPIVTGLAAGTLAVGGMVNVKAYGAIGDGASHPLSSVYATLAAAQAVYPLATALTDQIDRCAFDKVIAALSAAGGGRVLAPEGHYICDYPIKFRDNVEVVGRGRGSIIENISTATASQHKCNFWFGNLHPEHYGHRVNPSTTWVRALSRYRANACVTKDRTLTVTTLADASKFPAGTVVFVNHSTAYVQAIGSDEYDQAQRKHLNRVKSVNTGTGVITFEQKIGFDDASGPWLAIPESTPIDSAGDEVYFAAGCAIRNLHLIGYSFAPHWGAYQCHVENVTGQWVRGIWGNAWCNGTIRNMSGTISGGRAFEAKYGCRGMRARGLQFSFVGTAAVDTQPIIDIGEEAEDIRLDDYDLDMPGHNGTNSAPAAFNGCRNVRIGKGRIYAPDNVRTQIVFYERDVSANQVLTEDVVIDGMECENGGPTALYLAGSSTLANRPKNIAIKNSSFTIAAGSTIGHSLVGVDGIDIINTKVNLGSIDFGAYADGVNIENCQRPLVDTGSATKIAAARRRFNYSRETDGTFRSRSEVYLPSTAFAAFEGTPTLDLFRGSKGKAYALDAATVESISAFCAIPADASAVKISVDVVNMSSGTGVARFDIFRKGWISGDDTNVTDDSSTVDWTAAAQNVQTRVTLVSGATFTGKGGGLLHIRFRRNASHANDTLANDVGVLGLLIEFS